MHYLNSLQSLSRAKKIAALLLITTVSWMTGLPTFLTIASAAQMTSVSATASSSAPTALTNFMVQYTATNTVLVTQTIKITFSSGNSGATDEYSLASLVAADATSSQISIITAACGAVTPNQASINGGITNTAGNRSVTLTACGTISTTTAKTIIFVNNHIANPTNPGSYKITIGGTQADSGTAMTAVLSQVTVTASVDTTLVFTVTGVASGQSVNGETVSTTSTATAINYGSVASGTPVVAAQDLSVTTNAANGYVITVHEDQDLTAGNGSVIGLFKDGAQTATPIAWATPTAVLGSPSTYGHIGLTSNDTLLNSNEFFSGSIIKWAGNWNSTSTRVVLSHNGPADGTTQNIGRARVGYKILVSTLQPAATDYTNHIIYVCTPTF